MIRLLHICLILLTLASYLPPLVNPDTFWPVSTLGLLAPCLWFATLLFGLYWLFKRDHAVWLAIITLVLGSDMMSSAFAVTGEKLVGADVEPIKIASLNGHGFRRVEGEDSSDTYARMTAFLNTLDADILFLQEFRTRNSGVALGDYIQANTDFVHSFYSKDGPLAVFSRFPLQNGHITYFSNRANGFLTVDVICQEQTYRLMNIHLQTNAISRIANEVTQDIKIQEKGIGRKVKTMFSRYGRSNQVRTEQAREILKAVKKSEYPVIVGGDFNDIPTSFLYQLFRTELQDAHLDSSWGLGTTYQGLLPGLRIDYILPDHSFDIFDFESIPCPFSDHKAVRAKIAPKDQH